MGEFEIAQQTEELLDRVGEPDGSDAALAAAWERQRRVHLLLHARFGSDADATFASIRAAASGSRRERIADVIGRRTGRRMRRFSWQRLGAPLVAAAALLVVVLVGRALLTTPTPSVPVATTPEMILETIGSDLVIERQQQRMMPDAGMRLHDGDLLATGASATRVTFSDGTQVEVTAGSRVAFAQQQGKALEVQAGGLRADVARQPAERPLRIRTPGSQVEVVGTRFSVGMEPSGTRLIVDEGTVRLADQRGAQALAVTAGQQALASWFHAPRLVTAFDPSGLITRRQVPCDNAAAWLATMYGPITAEAHPATGSDPAHLRLGLTAAGRDGWGSRGIPLRLMDGDRAFSLRLRVRAATPRTVIAFDMADDVNNTWRLGEMPLAAGAGWQRLHVVLPSATEPPPARTTNGSDSEFQVRRLRLLWIYVRGVAELDVADVQVLSTPRP